MTEKSKASFTQTPSPQTPTAEMGSIGDQSNVETPPTNSPFGSAESSGSPVVEVLPVSADATQSQLIEVEPVDTGKVDTADVKTPVVESIAAEAAETADHGKHSATDPFKALGLRDDVYRAIKGFGYQTPTAIQAQTVSVIMTGRDVVGQAETGSGKTAAFAWPLLSQIDLKQKSPQILVLAPTRELALQVSAAFEKYGSSMKGLKCVTIYGGQSYETQFRSLDRGVHVVVGTPGRIMDHINRKTLKLDQIKTFVLDEADEMLRMGFIDDVEWVMERLPEKRQTVSFSATMPPQIRKIADKYLKDPAHITIKSNTATAESIEQSFQIINFREKLNTLTRLLESEETDGVIVFVKTRQTTNVVAEHLIQKGFDTAALNGDIAQNQRERTVNRLKSSKINILVATDVAARGLDVKRVSHVVNYDFPHDSETYVHRIGRTGRAGRSGKAILFVEPKEKRKLGWLEKDTKQKISVFKPKSVKEINATRVEKFKEKIEEATADSQLKFFRKLVETMKAESGHEVEDIAAALAVMAQGATPLLLSDNGNARPQRGERGERRNERLSDANKKTYRVEVGRSHGAGPGNIVGAIANEAGLHNNEIGKIKMFDKFSTIDLPNNLAEDLLDLLRNLQVSGQRLKITESQSGGSSDRSQQRRGRKKNNGSTDFVKRQKRERQSISKSEGFGETTQRYRKPERSDYRKPKYNPSDSNAKTDASAQAKAKAKSKFSGLGQSLERSASESIGKPATAKRKPASKPAKKYIKVRVRK